MDDRKLIRIGGLVAWAATGVPIVASVPLSIPTFVFWAVVFLVFGAAFAAASAVPAPPRQRTLLLLVLQAVCVIVIVLLLCDGFEGTLLVLVAMQLGAVLERRAGLAWITIQSLLLGTAIAIHWSLRPAILLAPPYFGFQLLAYFVFRAVHREAQARIELGHANTELLAVQEILAAGSRIAERLRISQELHDALGHHLTALSLNLEAARHQADGPPREHIETAQSLTRLLLADVRDIVARMKREETIELGPTLQRMVGALPSPAVHLDLPERLVVSDPEQAHVLLRCAQEIVTNAARHSHARNLWITIAAVGGQLEIRARDDGEGAADATPGFGLRGMRERIERAGGRIEFATAPGIGFQIMATLPARSTP